MSYAPVSTVETSSSTSSAQLDPIYPPGYDEDLESGPLWQNFISIRASDHIFTTLHVDTDLAAPVGRFADEETQEREGNLLLDAPFVNAAVRLRGTAKAKMTLGGVSDHHRVLQIQQSHPDVPTHFDVEFSAWGGKSIIVVPVSYTGSIAGHIEISPILLQRSSCLVKNDHRPASTYYIIAPPRGNKAISQSSEGQQLLSSVRSKGWQYGGKSYVCVPEEYELEHSQEVREEGEKVTLPKVPLTASEKRVQFLKVFGAVLAFTLALCGFVVGFTATVSSGAHTTRSEGAGEARPAL